MIALFQCSKCGICCKVTIRHPLYRHLDDGGGRCKFFDEKTNLCKIYDHRPDICNIDKVYELYFSDSCTKEEFYELNYKACKILQNKGDI